MHRDVWRRYAEALKGFFNIGFYTSVVQRWAHPAGAGQLVEAFGRQEGVIASSGDSAIVRQQTLDRKALGNCVFIDRANPEIQQSIGQPVLNRPK